jgi:hypothetical protein
MWMKIDDGLHAHRKTRAVTKSHPDKDRDSAPMGLWVLAGSWAARNNRDGWVPKDELDRWDDDWEALSGRLVRAGYWWPETRDGEDGYGFNDWQEWNNPDGPSASGSFGNHVRWHVNKSVVKADCEHCPSEPDSAENEPDHRPESHPTRPDHRPDIAPESGGESHRDSLRDHRPESLTRTRPDPTRTQPEEQPPSRKRSELELPDRFEEFWDAYANKVGRKKAETAYRAALKKPGVTVDRLITAAESYIAWQTSEGKHPQFTKHPATWLNGEHWTDERTARPAPLTRVGEHMALVRQLAASETHPSMPQIGQSR